MTYPWDGSKKGWGVGWSLSNWRGLRLKLQQKLAGQGKAPAEIRKAIQEFDKQYPRRDAAKEQTEEKEKG